MIDKPTLPQTAPHSQIPFSLEPPLAWLAILALFGLTTLAAFAGLGTALRLGFPLAAFVVGILLYRQYPIHYIGFTWWIWFLTPILRRIADYRSSYDPLSLMLTAPYLVTLVSTYTLLRHLPYARRQGTLPFALAAIGVLYSLLIGTINNSPTLAARAFLDWFPPVVFGFHLAVHWQRYPEIRRNTISVFLWMSLITGAYGIYQYMVAPEWDRVWLENIGLVSFGKPEPQSIRVWSTMNGPLAYAATAMAGLILLFATNHKLRVPAAIAGYLAFLLSLVRAAWGSWFVALLTFMSFLKLKFQVRLIATMVAMVVCLIPFTQSEPFSEVISSRFDSLSNVQDDSSFNARSDTYAASMSLALSEFMGRGLGGTWAAADGGGVERVALDSGILDMFFTLGWLGTIPYLFSLLALIAAQFKSTISNFDLFVGATRSVVMGLTAGLILGAFMSGLPGLILWGFLGIGHAAQKYYQYQSAQAATEYTHL